MPPKFDELGDVEAQAVNKVMASMAMTDEQDGFINIPYSLVN